MSQYQINPWGGTQNYRQYDVIGGINIGADIHPSAYYYATQSSVGQNPSGIFSFAITSTVSSEDLTTVYFTQTGNMPPIQPGSLVSVAGTAANNYTGMAFNGSSGWLQIIIPGFSDTVGAAGTVTCRNPAWTTGFAFIPTYTTKLDTNNQPIVTQLGNGYSQRMSRGVNPFDQGLNLVYQDIDKREMKAITHFVQDAAGVYPFEILLNDQYLNNQPHQKFTAPAMEVTPVSFGRYDVSVQLQRVFDP